MKTPGQVIADELRLYGEWGIAMGTFRERLAEKIDAAVLAEREACALEAEFPLDHRQTDYGKGYASGRNTAAEFIRRRGRDTTWDE